MTQFNVLNCKYYESLEEKFHAKSNEFFSLFFFTNMTSSNFQRDTSDLFRKFYGFPLSTADKSQDGNSQ